MPILPGQNHFEPYNANPALSSPHQQLLPVREKQFHVFVEDKTDIFPLPPGFCPLALVSELIEDSLISDISENTFVWK